MSSENSKNGYDNGEDKVSMNKDNIALRLDLGSGQKISVTVDGSPLNLVKYTVTYVADPIKMTNNDFAGNPIKDPYACHKMNIYVPETAAKNKAANIVLYVRNHGYLASELYNFTTGIVDGGNISAILPPTKELEQHWLPDMSIAKSEHADATITLPMIYMREKHLPW